jgi:hypothetical protein
MSAHNESLAKLEQCVLCHRKLQLLLTIVHTTDRCRQQRHPQGFETFAGVHGLSCSGNCMGWLQTDEEPEEGTSDPQI